MRLPLNETIGVELSTVLAGYSPVTTRAKGALLQVAEASRSSSGRVLSRLCISCSCRCSCSKKLTNHVSATRPAKAGRRPSGAKKQITLLEAAADWLLVDEVQTGLSQVISWLVTALHTSVWQDGVEDGYYAVSPGQARPRDGHGLHSPSNVTLAAGGATSAVLSGTDTCVHVCGGCCKGSLLIEACAAVLLLVVG